MRFFFLYRIQKHKKKGRAVGEARIVVAECAECKDRVEVGKLTASSARGGAAEQNSCSRCRLLRFGNFRPPVDTPTSPGRAALCPHAAAGVTAGSNPTFAWPRVSAVVYRIRLERQQAVLWDRRLRLRLGTLPAPRVSPSAQPPWNDGA